MAERYDMPKSPEHVFSRGQQVHKTTTLLSISTSSAGPPLVLIDPRPWIRVKEGLSQGDWTCYWVIHPVHRVQTPEVGTYNM